MNQAIYIENALVKKVGEFKTGVSASGNAYAFMELMIEWEIPYVYLQPDGSRTQGTKKQSAVVVANNELATSVRNMQLQECNPFESQPGSRVNIEIDLNGNYRQVNGKYYAENRIRLSAIQKI